LTPVLLAPLALALTVLVVGPVIAHLTRRRPTRRIPYGAMMLLERVIKVQKRRRRLFDPWVLLLRILAVLAVVMAVTRPELQYPGVLPDDAETGPVVVLIDDSLSMDMVRSPSGPTDVTLFTTAREQAVSFIRSLPDGVRVAAVSMAGTARPLVPELTADRGLVAAEIAELSQGHGDTQLAGALSLARRMLDGKGGRVVVFSDEAGSVAVPAAREELGLLSRQNVSLEPRPVRAAEVGNLFVTSAVYGDGLEGGSVRVEVSNVGPRTVEVPLVVRLPDGTEITAFVEVPASGSATETVTVPEVTDGGVAVVELEDPWLDADTRFAFHLPRGGAGRVLVVDGDPGPTPTASEVYFLERALAPWGAGGGIGGGVLPDVTAAGHLPELSPETHRVVFLANVSDPSPFAAELLSFVRQGGGLVISLGDNTTAERFNSSLGGLLPVPLRKPRSLVAVGQTGIPTELPDVAHPLFEPFARGGRAAFVGVEWTQLFTLEPFESSETRATLLRTASGIPLMVEGQVGRGRVLLFTGTVDLDWGNFPLQSSFMPFIQRLVSYLGGATGGDGLRVSGEVGKSISVDLLDTSAPIEVHGPEGTIAASITGSGVVFEPEVAGAYRVEIPGAPPLAHVAVNTAAVESDVRPGPELIALAAEVDPERYQRRDRLTKHFLALAGIFALLSALLAWRVERRRRREGATPEEGEEVRHAV
jgi:hypothetical protein